jgi:uncharacterized protein YuzE
MRRQGSQGNLLGNGDGNPYNHCIPRSEGTDAAMKPKLEYDAAADAAYIRFSSEPVLETEEVSQGIMLDYDRDGRIVGLEVLNARANLPAAALEDAA